jgi:hypothetical protein
VVKVGVKSQRCHIFKDEWSKSCTVVEHILVEFGTQVFVKSKEKKTQTPYPIF